MASIGQNYSPIDSLQRIVDDIPNSDKKKHKKHKKDKKERTEMVPQTLQQLFVSPTTSSSYSSGSSTSITVMDEKKYDLNIRLFHNCNLELFQAKTNMEWYVKCPFSNECGLFVHRNEQNAYIGVLNRKVHDIYRKLEGGVMCECNNQSTLKVSKTASNLGRPFFTCRDNNGCRFFQWADVGFTKKNEQLQKSLKEYGRC